MSEKITGEILEAEEIQDIKKTDNRGRINLGRKYADQEVKVAIIKNP